jgi:hypothetical protein
VSSALYDGNLGGLSGADAKCQALAQAAGLAGTYMAWLSDSQKSAAARLAHSSVPYVLVNGTVVAQDWAALGNGLSHAINVTEKGGPPPVGTYQCGGMYPMVWSYTQANGNQIGPRIYAGNCNDWTSTAATLQAHSGAANAQTSPSWTDMCQEPASGACAQTAALYCFEQ